MILSVFCGAGEDTKLADKAFDRAINAVLRSSENMARVALDRGLATVYGKEIRDCTLGKQSQGAIDEFLSYRGRRLILVHSARSLREIDRILPRIPQDVPLVGLGARDPFGFAAIEGGTTGQPIVVVGVPSGEDAPATLAKSLDLLKRLDPLVRRVGVLVHAGNAGHARLMRTSDGWGKVFLAEAKKLGLALQFLPYSNDTELTKTIDRAGADRVQALLVVPDPMSDGARHRIAAAARRWELRTVACLEDYAAEDGWLIGVGVNGDSRLTDSLRSAFSLAASEAFEGPERPQKREASKRSVASVNASHAQILGLTISGEVAALFDRKYRSMGKEPYGRLAFIGYESAPRQFVDALVDTVPKGVASGLRSVEARVADDDATTAIKELLFRAPHLVVTGSPQVARAVRAASPTVPVLIVAQADVVGLGLSQSIAVVSNYMTGLGFFDAKALLIKQLELIRLAQPRWNRVGVLVHAEDPDHARIESHPGYGYRNAAQGLGLEIAFFRYRSAGDLATAIELARAQGVQVLQVLPSEIALAHAQAIADHARKRQLPSVHFYHEGARAGGMFSFGTDGGRMWKRAGEIGAELFAQAVPNPKANLIRPEGVEIDVVPISRPFEQPPGPELVINESAFRWLAIDPPQALRLQADQVVR